MVQEPAQEPMVGVAYFQALLEEMPELMGTSAKPLDRDKMKGTTLYNYMICHDHLVSFLFFTIKSALLYFTPKS